jgi:hypothetical protein
MRAACPQTSPPETVAPLALTELGLSPDELANLRRSGYVRCTPRGRHCHVYELVYRHDSVQRRRYLGTDRKRAEAVRAALVAWQQTHTAQVDLKRATRDAKQIVRALKNRLAGPLAVAGYHFHGRNIRKSRALKSLNR